MQRSSQPLPVRPIESEDEAARNAKREYLAAEQRATAVVTRAVTAIDLRNPDWVTLELPESALDQGKEPRA